VTLSGTVGKDPREFVYEINFPDKTNDDRGFVEHLWARRKVGYLLDQIRANGEKKELVEETVALAKKYGIATPYTSYLIVPDGPMPVASAAPILGLSRNDKRVIVLGAGSGLRGGFGLGGGGVYSPLSETSERQPQGAAAAPAPQKVIDFAKAAQSKPGELSVNRAKMEDELLQLAEKESKGEGKDGSMWYFRAMKEAGDKKKAYDEARQAFALRRTEQVQAGKLGVDLSIQSNNLRNQSQLTPTALRQVVGRRIRSQDAGRDCESDERGLFPHFGTAAAGQGCLQARQSPRMGRAERHRAGDRYE
jgi:Ca-activated chloride channel family protein